MPLKGFICDGDGELHAFEDCIQCHIRGEGPARRCHMPLALLIAMSKNAEERRDAGISATMLTDCPRKIALQEEYEYFEKPSAYWARFRGSIAHLMIERYPPDMPGLIQERRVRRRLTIRGVEWEITGKPDWLDTARKIIVDFKTTDSLPKKLKDGHESQLNIYRWLVADGEFVDTGEPCAYEIIGGGIQYMSMKATIKLPAPMWSLSDAENFIRKRLEPLAIWKTTGTLPPPEPKLSPTTRWICKFCPLSTVCDELLLKQTAFAGATCLSVDD